MKIGSIGKNHKMNHQMTLLNVIVTVMQIRRERQKVLQTQTRRQKERQTDGVALLTFSPPSGFKK